MIAGTAAMSLRLLRLGGRRAGTSAALVGVGIAVGTALLAVALGGVHGWDAREDRAGWRTGDIVAGAGRRRPRCSGRPLTRRPVASCTGWMSRP